MDKNTLQRVASDPSEFQQAVRVPTGTGSQRFGDAMADFQREWFSAVNPSLVAVANGKRPPITRFWVERVKGTSKTSDVAVALLWLLAFSRRALYCQVGAADSDQAAEVRRAAESIIRHNDWLGRLVSVQRNRLLCQANDSEAEIITSDSLSAHGSRPDVLILDELVHHKGGDFASTCLDNSAKIFNNLTIIGTNSGFQNTWQHAWRELARTSDRWHFSAVTEPAPWVDPADVEESERRNSTERHNRLWRGIWGSGSGDALDVDDITAAIDENLLPLTQTVPGMVFNAGLDLGVRRDHAALAVVGVGKSQRYRLAACQSWAPVAGRDVDLEAVEHAVATAHKRFRLRCVMFDPHQAQLMAQRLRKIGVNMVEVPFVAQNLVKMAMTLLDVFRSRRIDMYRDDALIRDLKRLCIEEKSYGFRLESTRDQHGHSDRAIALVLALLGAKATPLTSGEAWGGVINHSRPKPEREGGPVYYEKPNGGLLPSAGRYFRH